MQARIFFDCSAYNKYTGTFGTLHIQPSMPCLLFSVVKIQDSQVSSSDVLYVYCIKIVPAKNNSKAVPYILFYI